MVDRAEYWERPDVVAEFAAREPDKRLMALLPEFKDPFTTRVLDLGCAGGRNTVPLAQKGFDFYAVDASQAMVEETRKRVGNIIGPVAARERVRVVHMDDLSALPHTSFDLVVALGVFHQAATWDEWERAFAEAVRTLRPGGRLLVSHFTPETDPQGTGVTPVLGEPNVFDGLPGGRATLLSADELDAQAARFALAREEPSTVGKTETETGRRVSVNALYRKR